VRRVGAAGRHLSGGALHAPLRRRFRLRNPSEGESRRLERMNPHALGSYTTLHLAQVLENSDPDGRGRIRVRLLATGMEVWASTVVPSAGRNYGVTCLPRIDEIVA